MALLASPARPCARAWFDALCHAFSRRARAAGLGLQRGDAEAGGPGDGAKAELAPEETTADEVDHEELL